MSRLETAIGKMGHGRLEDDRWGFVAGQRIHVRELVISLEDQRLGQIAFEVTMMTTAMMEIP